MGNWDDVADGEDIDINKYLDFRQYDTIADRDAASTSFGSAEIFHICRVVESGYYYYWNGAAWSQFPASGGAGAPPSASYVTINAEASLTSETQHKNITGANLHSPATHAASHQNGGGDEIDVTDLSGVLADEQDAGKIKGVSVDDAAIGAGKFLKYDGANVVYSTLAGGGDMAKAVYDVGDNGVVDNSEKLEGSTKAQVQNHTPIAHKDRHKSGGGDPFTSTDDLDCVARTDVRKNSAGSTYSRRRLNFIEGTGISLTISDDAANEEVDINIGHTGGSSFKLAGSYVVYKVGSNYYAMDESGNVDYSGTNFVTVVNNALAALTNGGLVIVHESCDGASIASTITVGQSNVRLLGQSLAVKLEATAALAGSAMINVSGSYSDVENLYFDCNSQADYGVDINGSAGYFHRLYVENANTYGIRVTGGGGGKGFKINWCRVEANSSTTACIYCDGTQSDFWITSCVLRNSSYNGGEGIRMDGSGVQILDNHIWGLDHGIKLAVGGSINKLNIVGNYIEANRYYNIYATDNGVYESCITGNTFWRSTHASVPAGYADIRVDNGTAFQYCSIVGNTFYGQAKTNYAIDFQSTTDRYNTITGNNIYNYAQSPPVVLPTGANWNKLWGNSGLDDDYDEQAGGAWVDPTPLGGCWEGRQVTAYNSNLGQYRAYCYANSGWRYVALT